MADRITSAEARQIKRLCGAGMSEREIRRETGRSRETIRRVLHDQHPAAQCLIEPADPAMTTIAPRRSDRCYGCGGLLTERPCRACAVRNLQRPHDPDGIYAE